MLTNIRSTCFYHGEPVVDRHYPMDSLFSAAGVVAREPYAFPGGYARALITDDGGILCHQCVRENYRRILESTRDGCRDGWQSAALGLAEYDEGEYSDDESDRTLCDHCGLPAFR